MFSQKELVFLAIGIVLVSAWLFENRYQFMHDEGTIVIRCNTLTGDCVYMRAQHGDTSIK